MEIFDYECAPLLKLFSRACCNDEVMSHFNEEECESLHTFMDCLQDLALEHSK